MPLDDEDAQHSQASRTLCTSLFVIAIVAQGVIAWRFWSTTWDDMAITLGFARSFALTGKIEPTPGSGIVEGYSTTLWMLLMAAAAKIASLPGTLLVIAKLSTLLLNVLNLFLLRGWLTTWMPETTASLTAGIFGCGYMFFETINGMETPMLLMLLLAMLLLSSRQGGVARWAFLLAGVGVVLTRWESIWLLIPFVLVERPLRRAITTGTVWLGAFLTTTALRWMYFGALVPNTVLAKRHTPYSTGTGLHKLLQHLHQPALIMTSCLPFAAIVGAYLWVGQVPVKDLWRRGRQIREWQFAMLFSVFAVILTTGIGHNWGPPLRSFYQAWPFVFALLLFPLAARPRRQNSPLTLAVAAIVSFSLFQMSRVIVQLREPSQPAYMPGATVENVKRTSDALAELQQAAGKRNLLYAGPDMGAVELYSEGVQVIDTGLLCNQFLARNGWDEFMPYVFERRKPDVFETHAVWTQMVNFKKDPLFANSYQPVWVGDIRFFVRKSIVATIAPDRLSLQQTSADGTLPGLASDSEPQDKALNLLFPGYLVLHPAVTSKTHDPTRSGQQP